VASLMHREGLPAYGHDIGEHVAIGPVRANVKGIWTPPLSCVNVIEVRGDLDGGMHPEPAPYGGDWP
jgi:hypothetical protein